MAQGKNPGKTLYLSQFGGERPIPPEFLAAMNRREEITSVPNTETLPELSDEIVESRLETNRTDERELHVIKKIPGNIELLDFRTNDQGQAIQVTSTLLPTGTTPPPPSATDNVAFKDLGNGWTIQEVAVEGSWIGGVFVPGVFSGNLFSKERPNLVPEKFRPAIPDVTTRQDTAGTAVAPTLSGDELRETQEQVTATKKRITIVTEAAPSAPITLDKGRDTNDYKQDVTVTEIYEDEATAAPTATALKDVEVEQLGNGFKVVRTKEVSAVGSRNVFTKEIPDLTPEKFRPAVVTATTRTDSAGTAVAPSLASNELRATQEQVTNLTKRTESVQRVNPSLPVVLSQSRDTNDYDQDVTLTETLMANATSAQTATALRDVTVQDLGDGRKVETLRDIAAVPGHEEFSRSRPNLIPEEFRPAIPTVVTQVDSAGTAVDPTLSGTELEESQVQVTAKIKRIRIVTQADPSVPVTLDKGLDTNNDQQSVVVTRKLIADATAAASVSALQDVSVKQLGNGFKVQETREIASVATHNVFARSRPNLVPEKFRPSIPTVTTRVDSAGTAVDPTLAGTELEETQEQFTELKKRITIVTQAAPSLPIALTGKETNQDQQVVTVVETLQTVGTTPTAPTALIDVTVNNLGDGNVVQTTKTRPSVLDKVVFEAKVPETLPERFRLTSDPETTVIHEVTGTAGPPTLAISSGDLMKREEQLTTFVKRTTSVNRPNNGYPILDGHDYDDALDILVPFQESISTAGANASLTHSTVTPLNDNLDLVRTVGFSALQTALDAYVKTFVGSTNIDFPAQLNGVAGMLESLSGANGVYNHLANWAISGNGSASLVLHGKASGSAGIMPDAIPDIQQTWGANVPCTHLLFFVPSGTSRATILTRIAGYMSLSVGSTLFDWPVFVPRAVTIVCHGEHVSGEASVDLSRASVAQFDYNGDPSGTGGESDSHGDGRSYDIAVTVKTVRIPPTIHAQFDITNDTNNAAFSATARIVGGMGDTGLIGVSGAAFGYVRANSGGTPLRVFATPGTSQVPNGNHYLYRLTSEPHNKGDRIRVHAEVVNFDSNRSVVP